jgi:hypothetical protein
MRLRDLKFEASLGYTEKPSLKDKQTKQKAKSKPKTRDRCSGSHLYSQLLGRRRLRGS